jgi:pimeloyl-ACP methyl ester carboxylesterase
MKTFALITFISIVYFIAVVNNIRNTQFLALVLLPALALAGCNRPDKPGPTNENSDENKRAANPLPDTLSNYPEPTVSYTEVNGRRLAYMECGRGQPVLLVHGGSGDMRVWENQMRAISSKYRVIAISCRGYYPSEQLHPDDTITLDTFVDDLTDVIHTLDLAPVHLVGHSSPGGFGSLLLARDHPELLRSLVLVEPPAFPLLGVDIPPKLLQILGLMIRRPRVAMGFLRFGAKGIRPAVKAFERGDDSEGLRIFMKANLGAEAFAHLSKARFHQAMANIRPLKAQIRAGFPPFSVKDARSIKVPVLLVSGEKSNVMLHAVTDKLEKLLPNVERVNIKNASHNMFETNPQAFNRAVIDFLNKHS